MAYRPIYKTLGTNGLNEAVTLFCLKMIHFVSLPAPRATELILSSPCQSACNLDLRLQGNSLLCKAIFSYKLQAKS